MVTAPHSPAPRDGRPAHVSDLLRLVTRDPGRPRLTWYGDDGERVELSGAVLENWVNKTTNLLVEEFDAGPGTRVVLDLPVHWRTVVWALAAWRVGATVVLVDENATAPGTTHADLVVTHRPDVWTSSGAELVAVALPALARRFDGALPPGAIDAASAVMSYGDQIGWAPEPDGDLEALVADEPRTRLAHADLLAPAGGARARRLLDARRGAAAVLRALLDTYGTDGSVVLLSAATAAQLDRDDPRRARIVRDERVDDDTSGRGARPLP
ncbi:TIGR03089 family protein [Cellulosimicrobium sp. 72-3]|uniref:TIGR03089 family protein n=1 Tax=Cellulosimicrobium sp. 72-3 TaxID=2731680 RepID=UPI00148E9FC3|nr:TIGR03089 family protein [Cellulosimicrobium sp. 72-3]